MRVAAVWSLVVVVASGAVAQPAAPPHHVEGGFRNAERIEWVGPTVSVPFFLRRVVGAFRDRPGKPTAIPNDGASLRRSAESGEATVTWIGHSTVLVQMDGVSFLTDPIWSNTASPVSFVGPRRHVPPALALDALPPIDFVVISHNHYDHLDLVTLRRLAERGTRFLVPLKVGALLRSQGIEPVDELDWWEHRSVAGVEVHCVPARHWSGRGLTDRQATLWSGWVVAGETRRFYFAGDTGYFAGFAEIGRRLGPFQLAAIPIGAYEPVAMMRDSHINPEEAVRAAIDVRAERVLGVHYGTFDLTDEPLDEPPRRFLRAASAEGLGDRAWVPPLGQVRRW